MVKKYDWEWSVVDWRFRNQRAGHHHLLRIIALLGLVTTTVLAAEAPPDSGLRVLAEKERQDMLGAYWTRMSQEQPLHLGSLAEWQERRALLLKRVMDGFGLDPRPPNVPLDLTYGDKLERDDCTITRVAFQTFPGLYATGYLYLPKHAKFPAPAVLHPHGHWANWSADNVVQSRCLGLAHRGYVSLAIQFEHDEDLATGLPMRGVFLWNNIRALAALESLPQVDKTRLGVTGASGGGMQATDLAAVDPRIKAAVIVAFPTYYHRVCYEHAFGCCYYSPLDARRFMDQQDLIALIAPRPAAVFTLTGDWTALSINHELKEVAGVYDLFSAEPGPAVANVEGQQAYRLRTSRNDRFLAERWEGPHDYTKAMRERMYWWLDWWLKDQHAPQPSAEENLNLEPAARLWGLQCRPPQAHQWSHANLATVVRQWRRFRPPTLRRRADLTAYAKTLNQLLLDRLGENHVAQSSPAAAASLGHETITGWDLEKLWYASEPDVRIPALFIRRAGDAARSRKVAIVVAANGKNDVFVEPLRSQCESLLKEDRVVLAIDQRLRGEWSFTVSPPGTVPEITWRGNTRVWGRPELGMAVHDIAAAIDYLATRPGCSLQALRVVGHGNSAGFEALLAAAVDGRIQECVADLNSTDFSRGYSDHEWDQLLTSEDVKAAPILAGILCYGDVGEIAALVAPRRLELLNANPRTSLATARTAYKLLRAAGNLTVQYRDDGGALEVPLVNGGFEQGTNGWTGADGSAPTLDTHRADLGQACLLLKPGQTVLATPVAVEPLSEYSLLLQVSKPRAAVLEVFLQRGGRRFQLAADTDERLSFEPCRYELLTRPGETNLQVILSAPAANPETGPVLIDTVRLAQGPPAKLLTPDGRELLAATGFANWAIGVGIPAAGSGTNWYIPYGPGSQTAVVAAGNQGRPALHLQSGPGTYVALASPATAPLRRGGMYRLEAVARGRGEIGLCFWSIPPHLTSRLQTELTNNWQTYTLDFFVESKLQTTALPIVSATGDLWLDHLSLKLIEPTQSPPGRAGALRREPRSARFVSSVVEVRARAARGESRAHVLSLPSDRLWREDCATPIP